MPAKKSLPAESVDDYLAAVPEDARAVLAKLRKTIKAAAPKATEVISYRIPTYKHHGPLVGFAAFKKHRGFYVMSLDVMRAHAAELKEYDPWRSQPLGREIAASPSRLSSSGTCILLLNTGSPTPLSSRPRETRFTQPLPVCGRLRGVASSPSRVLPCGRPE